MSLFSKVGRLILIRKKIINSLTKYYLALFQMSKEVGKKIISLQSRFFWSKEKGNRGIAIVVWSIIQLPKELRWFRVGDILMKNTAM